MDLTGCGLDRETIAAGTFLGRWTSSPSSVAISSFAPGDEEKLGDVRQTTAEEYREVTHQSVSTFKRWRSLPAPQRGEYVRRIAAALREHKESLARLVSAECGKILTEAEGEVQEMIDIADYAVGLSRSFGGSTLPSERPQHRMFEQWHPLGPVGVITAFNFPVAVWAWNAMIAAVCGDTVVWKPSEKTPLSALAVTRIVDNVLAEDDWSAVFSLVTGGKELGMRLAADPTFPLISATGSCRMGFAVSEVVAKRLARSLLELGGNNAAIVLADANIDLALRAVTFGAAGTAGQRCTTTRRLIVEESIADEMEGRVIEAFRSIPVGDPLDPRTLLGPLIDAEAVATFEAAIGSIQTQGGDVLCGGRRLDRPGHYVEPTVVRATVDMPIVQEETFAPILYVLRVKDFDEAIAVHNGVRQGLSSSIFTSSQQRAEKFLSVAGSDCGIANVNLGTSGAEIGGAFGGEKETGGGREAGSDAWKTYMRRQTCTINYGDQLPLAQGVEFNV